jgi:hypothetical protein
MQGKMFIARVAHLIVKIAASLYAGARDHKISTDL